MTKGIKRIGFPRAFWYFYFGPAFKLFFELLGYEVVVSPLTDRETLRLGSRSINSDHCVSVKDYIGHVGVLAAMGVDAIFVPNIHRTLRKWCVKFTGLGTPITRSCGIPNLPPLLEMYAEGDSLEAIWDGLRELGASMGHNDSLLDLAINKAKEMQAAYDQLMLEGRTVDEVLGFLEEGGDITNPPASLNSLLPDDAPSIGVVGHRYTIGNSYINGGMLDVLRRNEGCKIITQDMVSDEVVASELAKGPFPNNFWHLEAHQLAVAYWLMRRRMVEHLFLVSAGLCGTTSVIRIFVEDVSKETGVPMTYLPFDEETEKGITTRLSTPIRIVRYNRKVRAKNPLPEGYSKLEIPSMVHPSNGSMVVTTSRWGNLTPILLGALARTGTEVVEPAQLNTADRRYAEQVMPEDICYPAKITAVSILRALENGANAVVGIAARIGHSGQCRLDGYRDVQEAALSRIGYKDVEWLALHSRASDPEAFDEAISRLTNGAGKCKMAKEMAFGTKQLSACDEIDRMTCFLRPREVKQGDADRLRDLYLSRVYSASGFTQLWVVMREARDAFRSVPKTDYQPPRVDIGGEIYISTEPFANEYIERELGHLGLDVYNGLSIGEWFKGHILTKFYPSLRRAQEERIALTHDVCLKIGGHGRETVAELMLAMKNGADGFAQVAPFGCMPETSNFDTLLRLARQNEFPILAERHDTHEESSRSTRRRTFAYQLKRRKKVRDGQSG